LFRFEIFNPISVKLHIDSVVNGAAVSREMQCMLDRISLADHPTAVLENIQVFVRIGMHPWERHAERPNRLLVSVRLHSRSLFDSRNCTGFVNYDRVRERIGSWTQRGHTDLIETLLQDLVDFAFEDPLVEACEVRIVKPDVFGEAEGAGVEWLRLRPTASGPRWRRFRFPQRLRILRSRQGSRT
jgi:7,8-dihydroneopterin aldolase/epimerase/oxygenase